MKRFFSKQILAVAAGLVLATGLGWFLREFSAGSGLVNSSYDLLLVGRGEVRAREALMVYLDEKSYAVLGQNLNIPIDRALHVRLIDRLSRAGAKVIVFDIVFNEPSSPETDKEFARALKASGRVILAADNIKTRLGKSEITLPLEAFQETTAGMGYAEVAPSRDLVVRAHTPFDPGYFPTLSWAAAAFLKAPITLTQTDPIPPGKWWMNYYGRPNILESRSFYEVLDPAVVPDAVLSNKVVFVGARLLTKSAGQRKDEYPSPYGYWTTEVEREMLGSIFMAGVEIQATATLNLLRGDWLTRTSRSNERLLVLLVGLFFGAGLVGLRPGLASVTAICSMGLIAFGSQMLFRQNLVWWPWLILEVQILVAFLYSIVLNSIRLYVQKKLYEQTLSLYLSPKLVKKFANDPHPKLLRPGAEKQMLTILFSDIANFTMISEGLDSDELAFMMNAYFQTAVTHCIHFTDGTVVKYIGDAIFAFWNAPDHQHDHAVRSCEAALRFKDQDIQYINGHPLHTRIGLHTGVANVGNFGSTDRVDYTALGENINLASRMEGLNKYLGTTVLITGTTRAELGDHFVLRFLGLFRLKGFEKAVEVFELVGLAKNADTTRVLRDTFAEGLKAYQTRDFEAAEASFRRVLDLQPKDGPSIFYLARLKEVREEAPGPDWKGEVELKEK